ncbi:hypothetical protein SAMN05444354_118159 [Stigmatella aurantiaca]|uniref:Uncharacterized protein n=1 Tax=Stigmatella aurantiaca TaxID=41 RepID=A0A1H7ZCK5_STIAU|nr:hypothetical protein [Stigmatella aurantiaca]SEM55961.1 hypothetical protein SAMN05444354_118159 [Stigmatella aurantiaca]
MSQQPAVCRMVPYKLSTQDVINILEARHANLRLGGNHPKEGDVVPLVMVRIWPDEYGQGVPCVNGQLLLDANHTHWVTSVREGA